MAINIVTPPSAHDEAADQIEETVTKTVTSTKDGEEETLSQDVQVTKGDPITVTQTTEVLTVGVEFKMPIAKWTMLGFSVKLARPYEPSQTTPDQVFDEVKNYVEGKLNNLIEEQQSQDQAQVAAE